MISIPGYQIIEQLGQGGMATVYLALQQSVGRKVAIKVMSQALAADPSFSERFLKEAQMAHLSHPHIITIYDAGEIGNQNYIVMEYAGAGNLADRIRQGISVKEIVRIIQEIASALHYAHQKGVIHRDVKSENILLKEDGSAVLVDFGIAKAVSSGTQLTMVGTAIGSPNYMSPEQARGLALDGRSDLYSLGIVFYECLTGKKPYDSVDTYVIGLKHINDPIPQLPQGLQVFQPVIDKLLAKIPDDRYANGDELDFALGEIFQSLQAENSPILEITNREIITQFAHPTVDSKASLEQTTEATIIKPREENLDETIVQSLDVTQVANASDRTQIMSDNEQTRIQSVAEQQTVKKSTALRWVSLIIIVIVAGAGGWFVYTSKQAQQGSEVVSIPPQLPVEDLAKAAEEQKPVVPQTSLEPSVETLTAIEAVRPEVQEMESVEQRITTLLADAETYLENKQLSTPKDQNALAAFQQVLAIDPDNLPAKNGLHRIADEYLTLAQARVSQKNYAKAATFINKGLAIVSDHEELMALQQELAKRVDATPAVSPEVSISYEESFIKPDGQFFTLKGVHLAEDKAIVKAMARQSLTDKIYSLLLKQCNVSSDIFNSKECQNIHQLYYYNATFPLANLSYDVKSESGQFRGEVRIDKQMLTSQLKTLSAKIEEIMRAVEPSSAQLKQQAVVLSNYELLKPIFSLVGMKVISGAREKREQILNRQLKQFSVIASAKELDEFISERFGQDIDINSITSSNSLEITPFDHALVKLLRGSRTAKSNVNQLNGRYEISKTGGLQFNLWLSNSSQEIIDYIRLSLDDTVYQNFRRNPLFFTDNVIPNQNYPKMYSMPVEIALSQKVGFTALETGKKEILQVKMETSGFFYLAVHVVRENEQYSYLLPLKNADVPFVQTIDRLQQYQFVTMGEFVVTLPLGVEVLQLISANVNLGKYLPANRWDEGRQQFLIENSEGDIRAGINAVRDAANRIAVEAHNPDALWQEKILITSILN